MKSVSALEKYFNAITEKNTKRGETNYEICKHVNMYFAKAIEYVFERIVLGKSLLLM